MSIKSYYEASVVVTSDTCSRDSSLDSSGDFLVERLEVLGFNKVTKVIVEDERKLITSTVQSTLENPNNVLTITVGGTGLCPRDVTPEATSVLYDKECPGIAIALYQTSLRYSPHAALSRLTAGISANCLIVNFPGKLQACRQCFTCLNGFLEHALDQIRFDADAIRMAHVLQDSQPLLLDTVETQFQQSVKQSSKNTKFKNNRGSGLIAASHDTSSSDSNTIQEPTFSETIPIISELLKLSVSSSSSQQNLLEQARQSPLLVSPISSANVQNHGAFHEQSTTGSRDQCSIAKILISEKDSKPNKDLQPISPPSKMGCSESTKQTLKAIPIVSPYPLIDFDFALEIMSSLCHEIRFENSTIILDSDISLHSALGNILAIDIYSKRQIPPFPVSMMDGYVLHIPTWMLNKMASIKLTQAKLVSGLDEFESLQRDPIMATEFFCYQINTGGRVPNANFAVVPFEKTLPLTGLNTIPILKVEVDKYVRPPGSDLNLKDSLQAGTRIGPVELALIQSMGYRMLEVVKKPVIGVLSTGDELVDFLDIRTQNPYKVIDANGPLLASMFELRGFAVNRLGIAKDNPRDILLKIETSLRKCDMLVVTGGASMGLSDHVKGVIEEIGGVVHFGRVNIKPGKPVALASVEIDDRRKFIFSLPGNPVSAFITSTVLVIPFIEHGMRNHLGYDSPLKLETSGELFKVEVGSILDFDGKEYIFDGRLEFLRAKLMTERLEGLRTIPLVSVSFKQQSSRILSLKECDCLIIRHSCLKGSKFLVGQTYPALRLRR